MARRSAWRQPFEWLRRLAHSRVADRLFWISILLKAVDGTLETAAGLVLLGTSKMEIIHVVHRIFREELTEDPTDWLATFALRQAFNFTPGMKLFAVTYLVSHGLIKLILAGTLWRRRLWAYPLAGVLISFFIVYQMHRFIHTHSITMLLLTILDFIIIALLWPEYQRAKARMAGRPMSQVGPNP